VRRDYIVGLPASGDHQLNQMDFGPDGRLYFNVGSQSAEGNLHETPLSAATLVADVKAPDFLMGGAAIDVNTQRGYDPFAAEAKVRLFATGVRNSYDLAWHSNGFAYAPINGNDSGGVLVDDPATPANEGVTAPSTSIGEQLALLVAGGYYGHPNPSRGEYITHGGYICNAGPCDPWQHEKYPFPTQPEPGWNPAHNFPLLTTVNSVSLSPNPIVEYTAETGLKGWLLVGYTTARSAVPRIQAFKVDPATGLFLETAPLGDGAGGLADAGLPLDLAIGSRGRIYVGSLDGRLMMLAPLVPVAGSGLEGDYDDDGAVTAADYAVWREHRGTSRIMPNDSVGGVIGAAQYDVWRANFGRTFGSGGLAGATVPEPRSVWLLVMVAAIICSPLFVRRSASHFRTVQWKCILQ
jgi:hypothetical protein